MHKPTCMEELEARLPCRIETRDKIRALKRGSETYDDVLQRLYSEHAREMVNTGEGH